MSTSEKIDFKSLLHKKCYCKTNTGLYVYAKLESISPTRLIFILNNSGEVQIPIGNVLACQESGVTLPKGYSWQE